MFRSIKARIEGAIPHSATTMKFPTLKFLLLGLNYLLPFNTFLNSYGFYQKILDLSSIGISSVQLLLFISLTYQVAAILVNVLAIAAVFKLDGYERSAGLVSGFLSFALVILNIFIAWFPPRDSLTVGLLIAFAFLSSGAQSIGDSCNLFFAKVLCVRRAILFYSAGINVSGTAHALILIVLSYATTGGDGRVNFTIYYVATAGFLLLTPLIYLLDFGRGGPPVEEEEGPPVTQTSQQPTWNRGGNVLIALAVVNFTVTLFIYPSLILRQEKNLFFQYNNYVVFLGFNAAALCGNALAIRVQTKSLAILTASMGLRIGLTIPLMLLSRMTITNLATCFYLPLIILCGATSGLMASNVFYLGNTLINTRRNCILLVRLINLGVSIGLLVGSALSLVYSTFMNNK